VPMHRMQRVRPSGRSVGRPGQQSGRSWPTAAPPQTEHSVVASRFAERG
jgi:hypothetical protein